MQLIDPHKPQNDQRIYAFLTLENGLRALLVSDQEREQAGAALATIGASKEPDARPGLAHFLEHMLFLGTTAFPELDGFQKLITSLGGTYNAFTSQENTVYAFVVNSDSLKPALEHFSSMFSSPLLDPKYVERERNAVDAEFKLRFNRDSLRIQDATRMLMNPKNVQGRFFAGNHETLADHDGKSIADELRSFFEQYYRGDNMVLAVSGPQPIEVMAQWVEEMFKDVALPLNNETSDNSDQPLFKKDSLPSELHIRSIASMQRLDLIYPVPSQHQYWPFAPVYLLTHLLGHEGDGSISKMLSDKGYITSLLASNTQINESESLLTLSFDLTKDGVQKIDEIIGHVGAYFQIMSKNPAMIKRSYDEQRIINQINFRYAEKRNLFNELVSLTHDFNHYPPEDVLRGAWRQDQYDEDVISLYLERILLKNMLVRLTLPDGDFDQRSKWLNTQMRIEEIGQEQIDLWTKMAKDIEQDLHLPEPNPFLPDPLEAAGTGTYFELPRLILKRTGLELWFCRDDTFGTTKSQWNVGVLSNLPMTSLKDQVMNLLYAEMMRSQIKFVGYGALISGTEYQLRGHLRGLTLEMEGFNEVLPRLLHKLAAVMGEDQFPEPIFERIRSKMLRQLNQRSKDPLNQQAMSGLFESVHTGIWSDRRKYEALSQVKLNDFTDYIRRFRADAKIMVLSCGNLDERDAKRMAMKLRSTILNGATSEAIQRPQIVALEPGKRVIHLKDGNLPDKSLVWYVQSKDNTHQARAAMYMLYKLFGSDFFRILRTEQQLGYVVRMLWYPILNHPALVFVVESPNASFKEIYESMQQFVGNMTPSLTKMRRLDYLDQKNQAIKELLVEDLRLDSRATRYWQQLHMNDLKFSNDTRLIEALKTLSLDDLTHFANDILNPSSLRELAVQAASSPKALDDSIPTKTIKDPQEFKRKASKHSNIYDIEG